MKLTAKAKKIVLVVLVGIPVTYLAALTGYAIWFGFGPSVVMTTECNGTISKLVACPGCAGGVDRYLVVFRTASGDIIPASEEISKEIIDSGAGFNQMLRITYETEEDRDRGGKTLSRSHHLVRWRKLPF